MAKKPEYEIEDWETAYKAAKNEKERKKAVEDYHNAKARNSALREEYRLEEAYERSEKRRAKRKKMAQDFKKSTKKIQSRMGRVWANIANLFQKTK